VDPTKVDPTKVADPTKVDPAKLDPTKVEPPVDPTKVAVEKVRPPEPKNDAELCGDWVGLEPTAMLGKLSGDQVGCLERAYTAAPKLTDKGKVSRLLMSNAYGHGDTSGWERLVQRHLEEVDASDPDINYKYATILAQKGPAYANKAIKYADQALERRQAWTGETYKSRVYKLYQLRAAANNSLWKAAEDAFAANPSDDGRKKADDARNQTKVAAREWYEYALAAGKDTTAALQVCISAAGSSDYCKAG
jgi:hypothetical protein